MDYFEIHDILILSDIGCKEFTTYVHTLKGLHKIDVYKAGTKENMIIKIANTIICV